MIITIFAAGSQGDIQPCVALAKGLMNAGHQVRLAAPENFGGFIQQHDVDHYPLRGDVQKLMASDTGRDFMSSGSGNPIRSIQTIRNLLAPVVMDMAQDALDAHDVGSGLQQVRGAGVAQVVEADIPQTGAGGGLLETLA